MTNPKHILNKGESASAEPHPGITHWEVSATATDDGRCAGPASMSCYCSTPEDAARLADQWHRQGLLVKITPPSGKVPSPGA